MCFYSYIIIYYPSTYLILKKVRKIINTFNSLILCWKELIHKGKYICFFYFNFLKNNYNLYINNTNIYIKYQ